SCVIEGSRAGIAAEPTLGSQALVEVACAHARSFQIAVFLRRSVQLHRCQQRGVVIDDVFDTVVAVLEVVRLQVCERALGILQILRGGEFALDASRLAQARGASQSCAPSTPAIAEPTW